MWSDVSLFFSFPFLFYLNKCPCFSLTAQTSVHFFYFLLNSRQIVDAVDEGEEAHGSSVTFTHFSRNDARLFFFFLLGLTSNHYFSYLSDIRHIIDAVNEGAPCFCSCTVTTIKLNLKKKTESFILRLDTCLIIYLFLLERVFFLFPFGWSNTKVSFLSGWTSLFLTQIDRKSLSSYCYSFVESFFSS